ESRRIDNQLRGRAGRQGDKGQSKFFLSLEDDLLRIFGTNKMAGMLQKLGIKKGEVIAHPWITKALRKAQMKVEAYHYDIRKNILKFDDIMNKQRLFIFKQRNSILDGENFDLQPLYEGINYRIITSAYDKNNFVSPFDWDSITNHVRNIYDIEFVSSDEEDGNNPANVIERLNSVASKLFKEKEEQHVPLVINTVIKRIMIVTLDALWKDHIVSIGHLKQGIGLRSIGKQNPINEFKIDATEMFDSMMTQWEELVITRFIKLEITLFSGHKNQKVD
ncbi:MAG: preprotein translocase subunit SecA, partial [Anaplasmataceae bacterium]|nr:preprotein translocase subunit SecA [Anaplasmataceae bacterium]